MDKLNICKPYMKMALKMEIIYSNLNKDNIKKKDNT